LIPAEKRPSAALLSSFACATWRCHASALLLGALHLGIFERESEQIKISQSEIGG
jgi:hypothetical protein